jgi:hypothetical protein
MPRPKHEDDPERLRELAPRPADDVDDDLDEQPEEDQKKEEDDERPQDVEHGEVISQLQIVLSLLDTKSMCLSQRRARLVGRLSR